ncbi:MAG TPA: hypothetical protein VHC63_15945 [Acidimicrobiales bacterium]|nr:hypothetical protein [Acidimicrobiales bacterium]
MTINDNLRDAAYIAIGMGVIGFQRAQTRRQDLRKQFADQRAAFESRGAEVVNLVSEALKQADAAISPVVDALEAQVDNVVNALPAQARTLVEPARQASKDARQQLRSRVATA